MLCTACKSDQPTEAFISKVGKPTKTCKTCRTAGAAKFRAHYVKNAEGVRKRIDKWREDNPEQFKANRKVRHKRWKKKYPEKVIAQHRRWRKKNAGKHAANESARQAQKLKATPGWADMEAIQRIYVLAQQLKRETGDSIHVDHIVPLQSGLVCGLHTADNLRIVHGGYNSRKKNYTWPDMPDTNAK